MELDIFWTEFAKSKLQDIYDYYEIKTHNKYVAIKLINSIVDHTIGLEKQPYIGQIEEFLLDRAQKFRYLVYKNYKILYWINDEKDRIEIVHIFDTRQDPTKIRSFK